MELSSAGMELRDLNAFITVVDTGGFTRAAERLHLVQSAVSMAVKRLEREVDLVRRFLLAPRQRRTGQEHQAGKHC